MENIYTGSRDQGIAVVLKNGLPFSPARSLKVRNHSPDGFNWAYCGSGPAQLSLALLLEEVSKEDAERLYQDFKFRVIARLPQEGPWTLTGDKIRAWFGLPAIPERGECA